MGKDQVRRSEAEVLWVGGIKKNGKMCARKKQMGNTKVADLRLRADAV